MVDIYGGILPQRLGPAAWTPLAAAMTTGEELLQMLPSGDWYNDTTEVCVACMPVGRGAVWLARVCMAVDMAQRLACVYMPVGMAYGWHVSVCWSTEVKEN